VQLGPIENFWILASSATFALTKKPSRPEFYDQFTFRAA
jgi:hypothetical protein